MALFGVPVSEFGGLDLRSDADSTGGAIDMLNVDLDVVGRMRTRDGFAKFTTSAAPSPFLTLTSIPSLGHIIGPLVNGKQQVVNATSGALVSITAAASAGPQSNWVAFGDGAGNNVAYAGGSSSAGTGLWKWNGSAFSIVGPPDQFRYANVTPVDNRLMTLNYTGTSAGIDPVSYIQWSPAGAPESGSTQALQVTPGDGEQIRGVCNFANQTFVFKETKFFVFTGTTTDSSGNPIFNYRVVNTGVGAHPIAANACCCVAPDGVYFFGRDGIYRTSGGAPVKVSSAIDPLFGVGGPVPPYFQGQQVDYTSTKLAFMAFAKNRVYVTYDGTGGSRAMLIYDIPSGQWMYSNVAANGLCVNPVSGALTFSYQGTTSPTSTDDLGAFSSSATTDAGTNITGRYRTSIFTFDYRGRTPTRGIAGVEKIVRETIVDGSGTISYTLGNNWQQPANLPATRSLVLGTAPQVAQARDRTAVKGRAFSMQFSGTAPWTVERATMNLHGYEPTGVKET